MERFLIIQTAFIGDVVLATGLIEKLHARFPNAQIDFLVRKGNEGLLIGHPLLRQVLIWDKKKHKNKNLCKMLLHIRRQRYDKVINVQRFAATGLLTAFSRAKETIGFDKNPFSFLFSKKIPHIISTSDKPIHEIERNDELVKHFAGDEVMRPRLYPSSADYEFVRGYQSQPYICIAPASVWFTKQYPAHKWVSFINKLPANLVVYLIGAPGDHALCETIRNSVISNTSTDRSLSNYTSQAAAHPPGLSQEISNDKAPVINSLKEIAPEGVPIQAGAPHIINLAGKLSFLQSAALQQGAVMNYVNDSAPMHFASAVNAPTTAVYCSTLPSFGFGPLADMRFIVERLEPLYCRPCGLHGRPTCPEGHFKCAYDIKDEQLLKSLGH
ncbi:MAG TPA: glycosyltransferase family 9 protein [Chitinophagaceae bacterium]|nr:glycosyltransferase family 9 protein [Chitinophagaceae bacterium]